MVAAQPTCTWYQVVVTGERVGVRCCADVVASGRGRVLSVRERMPTQCEDLPRPAGREHTRECTAHVRESLRACVYMCVCVSVESAVPSRCLDSHRIREVSW